MNAYLKWYYGYKNFGDEMLFFGVVQRIFQNYPIEKLYVEVWNAKRFNERLQNNSKLWALPTGRQVMSYELKKKIKIIENKQYRIKFLAQILSILWVNKYSKLFKFFGGGEVLDDSREFPHDWRNMPLLFRRNIKNWEFILLWWISNVNKIRTKWLYKYLLPKARKIVTRDQFSYQIANQFRDWKIELYQDFATEIIKKFQNTKWQKFTSDKYILINLNIESLIPLNIFKIKEFCKKYPNHQKIFFPSDMNDDYFCYYRLRKIIPDLQIYDWTKYNLSQILSLFYNTDAGIWARLHFLLPLKIYWKNFQAIHYADKIRKVIWN